MKQLSETFKKQIVQRIVKNLLDIFILQMIRDQPTWGYRIKKNIEQEYGIKLRHGALYPLLNALENSGYLTSRKEKHGGRIRKVYEITPKGIQYLDAYYKFLNEQKIQMKDIEVFKGEIIGRELTIGKGKADRRSTETNGGKRKKTFRDY